MQRFWSSNTNYCAIVIIMNAAPAACSLQTIVVKTSSASYLLHNPVVEYLFSSENVLYALAGNSASPRYECFGIQLSTIAYIANQIFYNFIQ